MARCFKDRKCTTCEFNNVALFQAHADWQCGKCCVLPLQLILHAIFVFGIEASYQGNGFFFLQHVSSKRAAADARAGDGAQQIRGRAAMVKMRMGQQHQKRFFDTRTKARCKLLQVHGAEG